MVRAGGMGSSSQSGSTGNMPFQHRNDPAFVDHGGYFCKSNSAEVSQWGPYRGTDQPGSGMNTIVRHWLKGTTLSGEVFTPPALSNVQTLTSKAFKFRTAVLQSPGRINPSLVMAMFWTQLSS